MSNLNKMSLGKMPISQRAKQFLPFSSLNGLEDAYLKKEWEIESRQKMKDRIWKIENDE